MQEAGVGTDESGKEIVGASNTVAGVVVQGDLGWRGSWRGGGKI